jgi:hypothetical protein
MFFVLVILLGLGIMMRGRRSINTLLRDLDRGPSRAAAATNAIREAGTNLLPELLRIGFQNDSGMDLFLRSTLKPFLPKYHPPSERFRIGAHTAISNFRDKRGVCAGGEIRAVAICLFAEVTSERAL